jgi:hypothetical protein
MSTIRTDVAETTETAASDEFDATSAFLTSFGDEADDEGDEDASRKPSNDSEDDETAPTDNDEDADDSDESPDGEGDDEEGGEPEGEKKVADSDDILFKIKVGDEEHEVPAKDLKRLYGQEAALTKKSQEVATLRQQAEARATEHVTALQAMHARAQERSAPYKQIDWMAVSKDPNISAEEASALRTEAQRAFEEEAFYGEGLQGVIKQLKATEDANRIEAAKACVKALSTPGTDDKPNPTHIEGWNDTVYNDIRQFGIKLGIPAETVNTLTDPAALKIMHMALQFSKGASKVQTIKTNKVNKTPKKIVKTSNAPVTRDQRATTDRKATVRAMRQGKASAADAFFASFGNDDE